MKPTTHCGDKKMSTKVRGDRNFPWEGSFLYTRRCYVFFSFLLSSGYLSLAVVTTNDNVREGKKQHHLVTILSLKSYKRAGHDGNERTDGQRGIEQVGHVPYKGRHPFSTVLDPIRTLSSPGVDHSTPWNPSSTQFHHSMEETTI